MLTVFVEIWGHVRSGLLDVGFPFHRKARGLVVNENRPSLED